MIGTHEGFLSLLELVFFFFLSFSFFFVCSVSGTLICGEGVSQVLSLARLSPFFLISSDEPLKGNFPFVLCAFEEPEARPLRDVF